MPPAPRSVRSSPITAIAAEDLTIADVTPEILPCAADLLT